MKRILVSVALLSTFAFSAQDCAEIYNSGNFQKAGDCFIKQIKINNSADNNYAAGDSLLQQGRFKEALPYMQKAEQLTTNESDLGFIYNELSVIYANLGNRELELDYDMKYLNISLKNGDKKNIAVSYNNLGIFYDSLNDNNKALEYYLKSLDYKAENEKSTTYNNIAMIYKNLGNYDKANEFYNKAIDLNLKIGNYLGLCAIKTNFGFFKFKQENYAEADKILNDANTICHNVADIANEANGLIFLGLTSLKQNNIQSAKSYYDKAKTLANKSGDSAVLANLKSLESRINSYNQQVK